MKIFVYTTPVHHRKTLLKSQRRPAGAAVRYIVMFSSCEATGRYTKRAREPRPYGDFIDSKIVRYGTHVHHNRYLLKFQRDDRFIENESFVV